MRRGAERGGAAIRLLFGTDFHGSAASWQGFVAAALRHGVDALVYGGDFTPYCVAVATAAGGSAEASALGVRRRGEAPASLLARYRAFGVHAVSVTPPLLADLGESLRGDRRHWHAFVAEQVEPVMHQWCRLLVRELPPAVAVTVVPGNHDPLQTDAYLRRQPHLTFLDGEATRLPAGPWLLGLGWTNPSPGHSPRECSEGQLAERLDRAIATLPDPERAILCLHCPPHNTPIDLALPPGATGSAGTHVGAVAVRRCLETHQPLLSLHGHIHEAPGRGQVGRTTCLNPGSQGVRGASQAYLVEVAAAGVTAQTVPLTA